MTASLGSGRAVRAPESGVAAAVAGVRKRLHASLARAVGAWCAAIALVVVGAAPLLAGADGWGAGSPAPALLVGLLVAVAPAGFALRRVLGRRWCRRRRVAGAMDASVGLAPGAVLGSLELSERAPPGTSPALRELAVARVSDRLAGDAKSLAGALGARLDGWRRRSAIASCVALAAPLLALALSPRRAVDAWQGMARPLAVLAEAARPPVTVEPGTAEVPRGAAVAVVARAPGRVAATLFWEATGRVLESREIELTDGEAATALPPVEAETRYWVETPDGAASERHVLTPVDPLFVSHLSVQWTHPPHTRLPPAEHRAPFPALTVPRGARARIVGAGSRDVGAATLVDSLGVVEATFAVRGARFEGRWAPTRSGTFRWEVVDAAGAPAATAPSPLVVRVAADAPPRVEILFPARDTAMPLDRRQPLVVRASDDYGVQRLEVVSWRITAFGSTEGPATRRVELEGLTDALLRPVLDASVWDLSPGDTVRYRVRAVDNHPSAQSGLSAEYALWVAGASEAERSAQERLDEVGQGVEELAGRARDLEVERRARASGTGAPPDFGEREELARELERHREMLEAVDSLQRELAELRESLDRGGLADPEARRRVEALEGLLDDAAPEESLDAAAELERRLAEMDPRELEEALARMAADRERLRERLEDSLAEFRDAAIEQDFRATGRAAEELAREQRILADAMAEGGDDALRAEQQRALEARADELGGRLEDLEGRLEEAGEAGAEAGVEDARRRLDDARRSMRSAERMASQGRRQRAGQEAQRAAGDLSELSRSLDDAKARMLEERMAQLRSALAETASGALALARGQTELRRRMQGATATELAGMRSAEAAIAQGVRNLAENYAEDTEMAVPGARDLLAAAGEAMERLDATLDAMGGAQGRSSSPVAEAELVVGALNEVARMAMAAGRSDGQAQASGSATEQMQQLQELAQSQGEIVEDAAALTPMRLGERTMADQVEEVSGRQRDVARELGEMSERDGEGSDPLGDLSAMAAEAERLAEALARGRLDPEVLRRQERLFHRLLDAGRTLERDEESEERESDRAGAFDREAVDALGSEDVDALRFALPGAGALRALSPAQRDLVLRYFERLNRSPGGGAPAGTPRR